VALTAYALPKEQQTFLNQGFQTLITKPIDEEKLTQTISQYLPEIKLHAEVGSSSSSLEDNRIEATVETVSARQAIHSSLFPTKVIDIEEGISLCNGNSALAETFLAKFLENLPGERDKLERLFNDKALEDLEECVHKLHGACHYCGVPKLRVSVKEAEHALKTHERNLDTYITPLLKEIDQVLEEAQVITQANSFD
jgi:two-component system sensor histidine kinase BarA